MKKINPFTILILFFLLCIGLNQYYGSPMKYAQNLYLCENELFYPTETERTLFAIVAGLVMESAIKRGDNYADRIYTTSQIGLADYVWSADKVEQEPLTIYLKYEDNGDISLKLICLNNGRTEISLRMFADGQVIDCSGQLSPFDLLTKMNFLLMKNSENTTILF